MLAKGDFIAEYFVIIGRPDLFVMQGGASHKMSHLNP